MNRTTALTIDLRNSDQIAGDFGGVAGFENVNGSGSTGTLTFFGDSNANVLRGGAGADWFYASAGADERYGGAGDDIFFYSATDVITDGGTGKNWLAVQQGAMTIDLRNVADQSAGDTVVVKATFLEIEPIAVSSFSLRARGALSGR